MAERANQHQLDLGFARPEPVAVRPMVAIRPPQVHHRPAAKLDERKIIDWFQVIAMLSKAGYSVQSISDVIRVPRTTLIGWRQGAEPRYSEGESLIAFWIQITGLDRDKLPTCEPGDWRAYHSK